MAQISLVVFHGGKWDASHNYVDYKMKGVLINADISYSSLVQKLAVDLQLGNKHHSINLKFNLDQKSSSDGVIELKNDEDIRWFLNLVKDVKDCSCPLVVSMSTSGGDDDDVSNGVVDNEVQHVVKYAEDLITMKANDSTRQTMKTKDFTEKTRKTVDQEVEPMVIDNVDVENLPQSYDVKEKLMFSSKFELKKALHFIAMKNNFEFKTKKSNNVTLVVVCAAEEKCDWYVRASRYKGSELWKVRKYVSKHTCSLGVVKSDHRQATSAIVSQFVKGKIKIDGGGDIDPGDIVDYMRVKHGISISYNKAWRARDLARVALKRKLEDLPTDVGHMKVDTPELKRRVGRPKKEKMTEEVKKGTRCGHCGELGHNRKTCKNPIPPTNESPGGSKKVKINPLLEA